MSEPTTTATDKPASVTPIRAPRKTASAATRKANASAKVTPKTTAKKTATPKTSAPKTAKPKSPSTRDARQQLGTGAIKVLASYAATCKVPAGLTRDEVV